MFWCNSRPLLENMQEMVWTHIHCFGNVLQLGLLFAVIPYEPDDFSYTGVVYFVLYFFHSLEVAFKVLQNTFQLQYCPFGIQSTTVACQRMVATYNMMAGRENRHRIGSVGIGNRRIALGMPILRAISP